MPRAFLLAAAIVVVACGPALGSPQPATPPPPPAGSLSPSPSASLSPSPSAFPFPDLSEIELAPGRYHSSPPFDLDFTFEIPGVGWQTAHLNGEFFDVMRLDDPSDPRFPTRWVAWAHPAFVYGTNSEPAANLTPEEAAQLLSDNPALESGPVIPFSFAGLDGVGIDLHADLPNTNVFGGPDGNFGLEPSHDLRLGIVRVDSEMLLVLCLAAPDELDEACAEVQPILDSAQL